MNPLRVAVIGGGPAGSATAIHLARAGHSVSIVDKATFPRDKCCGDGLTTSALRQLEALGFDPSTVPSWRVVEKSTWRSPTGHTIELTVPDDGLRIAVARRDELDIALLQLAKEAGVSVYEGHAFVGAEVHGDEVHVQAADMPTLISDYVIGADGMWSPLRRAVAPNPAPYLGDIHAFRQYFTNVTGIGRDQLWISFEPDLLPGYVWSFPSGDGGANVGFGIPRTPGESVHWMKDAWTNILERPHVRAVLGPDAVAESAHKAWPIPASIQLDQLCALGGRVLFVGDAARVVDPLTGEGIGQALETGDRAARAIMSAGATNPARAEALYVHGIKRGMAIDNRVAKSLSRLVTHKTAARAVIRMAPKGPWRGRYAIKWAFEDNPRAALFTPWRWKERFANKGGAYQ